MTNLFIITLPVVITINLLLGVIVFLTHMRRLTNRVFAILSLIFAIWLACQYFGSITENEVWLAFWIRQACATSVFIPLFFHLLRAAATHPHATLAGLLRRAWPWVVAVVLVAVLSQTLFFMTGARLSVGGNAIGEPLYGPGFSLFVGFLVIVTAALIWSFFLSLARAEGVCRMELQIMAFGSLFAFVPGILLVLIIPLLTGSSQSARFTPLTVVIWHGVMAYGIATRHIMGIGEFLRHAVIWMLVTVILAVAYGTTFYAITSLPFYGSHALLRSAAHVVAAIAVALGLAPIKASLIRQADALFESNYAGLNKLVHEGSALARSITTVEALFADFCQLLRDTLGVSGIRIYLHDGTRFVLRASESHETKESVDETDPLAHALRGERQPLIRDVLRRAGGTPVQMQAERALVRLDAEAAVALKSKNGLAGFLLLGRRWDGRVFGKREEEVLALLGDQLGFAIENAMLYTQLQDARVYNDVLLDNLVTGVVASDHGGRVTVCNREARRILRLDAVEEVIGCFASDILPAPVWDALRVCIASERGARDQDLVLRPEASGEQSVRLSTAVFGGLAGNASGALLVIQDTTTIRKLEEHIRRNDRLASIGTLAAGMAHEIKNPLVCLKTFAHLLPTHYDDPDFRNTFIPLLATEIERINAIVSQLLNLAHPVKPTLVPLALHASLDAACTLVAQQVSTHGLILERRYEAEHDRLLGDQGLLIQVFLNLLLNGLDALERGGTLTITTRTIPQPKTLLQQNPQYVADTWIEARVHDTGIGIAPGDLKHIFDPFFTTKANGTGLGLSVAHGIVLEHRGLIDVESVPGAGTCFRVLLPLLDPDTESGNNETKGEA